MEEILGRLRSYGTLQPDSLEAMRNEYVVALLYASIHIVMDITDKEFSMRPQYGIVGEESRGRVDFAIKVIFFCYSSYTHVNLPLTRTMEIYTDRRLKTLSVLRRINNIRFL